MICAAYGWDLARVGNLTLGQLSLLSRKCQARKKAEAAMQASIIRLAVGADAKEFTDAMRELTGKRPLKLDAKKVRKAIG